MNRITANKALHWTAIPLCSISAGKLWRYATPSSKIGHDGLRDAVIVTHQQAAWYLDRCGAEEGHRVSFDRTPDKP